MPVQVTVDSSARPMVAMNQLDASEHSTPCRTARRYSVLRVLSGVMLTDLHAHRWVKAWTARGGGGGNAGVVVKSSEVDVARSLIHARPMETSRKGMLIRHSPASRITLPSSYTLT